MCGIAGFISPKRFLGQDKFSKTLDLIAHRGPDSRGELSESAQGVWLGHTRLAIVDLSPAGHQPMATADNRFVLVFNGELYNFSLLRQELLALGVSFQSNSDTEVVLKAWAQWGQECLTKLIGMFAFCVWDKEAQTFFLARDRAGEKPLYYQLGSGELIFGSEQQVFSQLGDAPLALSQQGLLDYLNFGYTLGRDTLLAGVQKLEPGTFLKWKFGEDTAEVSSFYELPDNQTADFDVKLAVEALDHTLGEVIQDQLLADVPVGLLLSGGLDSSLIASYASKIHPEIESFTVVFPDFKSNDESAFASSISRYFGTKHRTVEADQVDLEEFITVVQNCETPVSDPAFYPTYLLSKEISKHCKVALSGDGADEVFGGYERYQDWIGLSKRAEKIPEFLAKSTASFAERFLPIGYQGRQKLLQLRTDFSHQIPAIPVLFQDFELSGLLKPEFNQGSTSRFEFPDYQSGDFVDAMLRHDFKTYLGENILTKVDRSSMLCGLELRAPFLDQRILDFAFAKVPSDQKVTAGQRKILLKKVAQNRLPLDYDFNRKQGFVPPIEKWFLHKDWNDLILKSLLGPRSIFRASAIKKLLTGQEKGRFNKRRIYSLLVLQLYLEENRLV